MVSGAVDDGRLGRSSEYGCQCNHCGGLSGNGAGSPQDLQPAGGYGVDMGTPFTYLHLIHLPCHLRKDFVLFQSESFNKLAVSHEHKNVKSVPLPHYHFTMGSLIRVRRAPAFAVSAYIPPTAW
jgi:hypothetical protein